MPTVDEALQIGWKQHQAGNVRGAEDIYRQVLAVAPGNENAWCFLGMACHDQGRYDEAATAYREAIRLKPNFPVALSNFGNTLKQQGKLSEAEASCREALRYKPDYSTAYNNLGVVLVAQGRLEAAAATFEKSLSLMPNDAVAQANLGAALVRQGKFNEGTEISQRALRINPNYAEAHKNLAIVWLLLGDFQRGWPEYEWRWRCPGSAPPEVRGPRWEGEPVAGRRILLHWEQGLGDTVHFVRFARHLKRQGAQVIVCCQKPLKPLLSRCAGIDELVAAGEPLPPFDFWCPLLSVPGVLQLTAETIPGDVGYIEPDPELVQKWRRRLENYPGFRIGICWQGSPDFHADRQRSIPLRNFEPLARIPGVRLISLQKGFGTEQLAEVREQFEVIDFGAELDETTGPFLDTAALMQALDLVISSDTCVPHLAAAMGRPTWVGLSVSPDWRWLLGREDTPWYPTMRLFRQSELGDWDGVFERLNRAVQQLLHESPRQLRLPLPAVTDPLLYACGRYELRQTSDGVWWGDPREVSSFAATGSADPASMGVSFVEEQLLLHQLVNPGEVVVELGARTAARTLALARRVGGDGLVISLAADPEALLHLCTNVALNGLHQVRCVGIGTNLSGEGGPQGPEPTAARRDPGARSHRDPESIGPPWDLDAQSLAACHLLTMDAPGWEGALLQGARETIRRCQPVVYVRRVDPAGRPPLIDSLRSMGYQLYTWQLAPDVQGDSTDLAAAGHLLASSRPLDEEALRLKPLFPS